MHITIKLKNGTDVIVQLPRGTTMTSNQLGVLVKQAALGRVRNGLVVE